MCNYFLFYFLIHSSECVKIKISYSPILIIVGLEKDIDFDSWLSSSCDCYGWWCPDIVGVSGIVVFRNVSSADVWNCMLGVFDMIVCVGVYVSVGDVCEVIVEGGILRVGGGDSGMKAGTAHCSSSVVSASVFASVFALGAGNAHGMLSLVSVSVLASLLASVLVSVLAPGAGTAHSMLLLLLASVVASALVSVVAPYCCFSAVHIVFSVSALAHIMLELVSVLASVLASVFAPGHIEFC